VIVNKKSFGGYQGIRASLTCTSPGRFGELVGKLAFISRLKHQVSLDNADNFSNATGSSVRRIARKPFDE